MMLSIASFIIYDNYNHSDKYKVPVLSSTKEFVQTVKEAEQMGLKEKGQWLEVTADGSNVFVLKAHVGVKSKKQAPVKRIHVQ